MWFFENSNLHVPNIIMSEQQINTMTCNYEGSFTSLLVLLLSFHPPEANGVGPSNSNSIVANSRIDGHNVCKECKQSQSQRVGREKRRRKVEILVEE